MTQNDLTPEAVQASDEHRRAVADAVQFVRRRLAQGHRDAALYPGLCAEVAEAFHGAGWIVEMGDHGKLIFGLASEECARLGLDRILAAATVGPAQ